MPKSRRPNPAIPRKQRPHHALYGWVAAAAIVALAVLAWFIQAPPPVPVVAAAPELAATQRPPAPPPPQRVDEGSCQACHAAQVKDWQGSHHQLAMQAAAPATVLGDFNNVSVQGATENVRFFRQGDEYWVNTPGADGQAADFKVAYTFGVAPLQQYLLEVPGGRLQALGVAWDTQERRWFPLYPGQGVTFKDPLHWSKPAQNANFMCVECHTTGFKRNFDSASNTFASHWDSLGVGCQACHGPASNHLAWAARKAPLANAGFEVNLAAPDATREIETCARCHIRRAPLDDGYANKQRLMDDYLPALLSAQLYSLDGKIQDEVFEVGSFQQSKMFDKGVRCSNCHNPHSSELKVAGNGVCLQCHNTAGQTPYARVDGSGLLAKDYTAPEHTHHQPSQPGSQCVDCHMPGKFYMVNDYRHDHGFTLPNPERAARLGTPDACLGCHQATAASEINQQFRLWYGSNKPQPQRYDEGLWLIRAGKPGAADALATLLQQNNLPAIRRATLLAEVPAYPSAQSLGQVSRALQSPIAQVRESAVHAMGAMVDAQRLADALAPLLSDPVRAVRIAAARELLQPGASSALGPAQPAWDKAIGEYQRVQLNLAERAEADLNLAMLYQATGRADQVEPALRTALLRDPDFLPAVVTLSQWLDNHQRSEEASGLITQAQQAHPESALLAHTQGLRLIRARQMPAALAALRQAAVLEPGNPRYSFVLGVALHDSGQLQEADSILKGSLALHPANRELRLTLANYLDQAGDSQGARQLLLDMQRINPQDPIFAQPNIR